MFRSRRSDIGSDIGASGQVMRRRDFIGLAGAAALQPFAANAQQRPRRLAFVHTGIPVDRLTESGGPFWVRRFYETMRTLGYVEGGNLVVDRLSAEGHYERFAAIAGEVIGRHPDVIVTNSNAFTRAFVAATSTIPIVAIVSDPVTTGLVTNLARPGGNLTGVSVNAGIEIFAKRVEILKEAVPSATKVGHLFRGRVEQSHMGAARRCRIAPRYRDHARRDAGRERAKSSREPSPTWCSRSWAA